MLSPLKPKKLLYQTEIAIYIDMIAFSLKEVFRASFLHKACTKVIKMKLLLIA